MTRQQYATTIVLTVAAGFLVEWFLGPIDAFSWPLFLLGAGGVWVLAWWWTKRPHKGRSSWMYQD